MLLFETSVVVCCGFGLVLIFCALFLVVYFCFFIWLLLFVGVVVISYSDLLFSFEVLVKLFKLLRMIPCVFY